MVWSCQAMSKLLLDLTSNSFGFTIVAWKIQEIAHVPLMYSTLKHILNSSLVYCLYMNFYKGCVTAPIKYF